MGISAGTKVIAVGSGKGGVGKSTTTLNLALALSESGVSVGVADADVFGPNIPIMVNLARKHEVSSLSIAEAPGFEKDWQPTTRYGLEIMSVGFLIGEGQAIWNAELVTVLSSQLINKVRWGNLDYLMVDLPPGSADITQRFITSMPFAAAVLVVTPQDVAHLDAKRALTMYRMAELEVLGAVENFTPMACPHCQEHIDVFHEVSPERSLWAAGVEKLASVQLDPAMSRATDSGHPIVVSSPNSPEAEAYRLAATKIAARVGSGSRHT